MNQSINSCFAVLNNIGRWFCNYGTGIFIQSGILIILLLIIDLLMRKRMRATFRYWIWMLVFLKLILSPSLSLPTGIGYWYGNVLVAAPPIQEQASTAMQNESAGPPALKNAPVPTETPQVQSAQVRPEPAFASTPAASNLNTLTWQAVAFLVWLVGLLVFSVLMIQRVLYVRRLIAQSEPAKDRFIQMLDQCHRKLGIKRDSELRLSGTLQSPAVCGLFRPVILMPTGLLERLSPDKLRVVLIHELCHVKRGDLWMNSAQTILQIIYFYNPLVWLVNVIVRRVREQAVDEMVLVTLGTGVRDYSHTLIDIAEMAFIKTSLSLRLIGVVESKKALSGRIKHLLSKPFPKTASLGLAGLIVIIITAAILLPMAKGQSNGMNLFDQNKLIKFKSKGGLAGNYEAVGSTRFFTNNYSVKFRKGEKLLIVAELYKPGEPMQVLGHKVFDSPQGIEKLNGSLSYSFNQPKTVTTHHGNITLGEQVFDIPEFTIDNFPSTSAWSGSWSWFHGDALRQSTDRLGRDSKAMEILFYYAGSYSDTNNNKAQFWIPASHATPVEAPYAFVLKAIPLSRLEKLYVEPIGGYQGLDGKLMEPEGFTVEKADVIADEYKQRLLRIVEDAPIKTYTMTLPNSTTVELLGVCKHPTAGEQWWRPDGSLITGEVFGDFNFNNPYYVPDANEYTRVFAIKLGGRDFNDTKLSWNFNSLRSSFYPDYEDEDSKKLKSVQTIIAKFSKDVQFEDLTIRLAVGDWKFAAQVQGGTKTYETNDSITDRSVIFHEADNKDGNLRLIVTHLLGDDYDCRIVVYDNQGKLHEPVQRSNSGGEMRLCKGYFDEISPDQIKYVRLQARPYERATFRNISLHPGVNNNVQMKVKKSVNEFENKQQDFVAALPNSVEVELVALFTGQSKEDLTWWRPDGTVMSQQEYTIYESKIIPSHIRHHETWEFEYGYILRCTPSDVSVMVDVTVGMQGAYGHPGKDGITINYVESDKNQREGGLPQIGDINVAAAYGPFTPKGWNIGSMGRSNRVGLDSQSFLLDDGSTIMLTSVRPDHHKPESGLLVDTIVNANDVDINVLYESNEGMVNKAESHSLGGSSLVSSIQKSKPMIQRTFRFESIQQEDLKKIAVEYRRFKGITFKDVALKPNVKTNVQIEAIGKITAN